jgi:hypothetical protein
VGDLETATQQTVIFKHNMPVIGWIGAPVVAAVVTWSGRDQWFSGHPGWVVVWLLFIGAAVWALLCPRVVLTISRDGVVVREIWLWHSRESRHAKTEISVPEIREAGDDDYRCRLRLSDGRHVTVGSSASRKDVEELRASLLAALRPG